MPTAKEILEEKPAEFYRLLSECIKVAEHRGTIYYEDAGELIDEEPINMHPWVGALSREMDEHGHPMLSAVIVGKDDDTPGEGFYTEAQDLDGVDLDKDPEDMSKAEKREFWERQIQQVYDTFSR